MSLHRGAAGNNEIHQYLCYYKLTKQLEEEKQILLQGLAMVDQARIWYLKQINLMEEKQRYVSKASHSVSL
jgi:flagellar biosynthesis/type III secretory pathway chaperone